MNIVYNDIPPVIRNKSEESDDFYNDIPPVIRNKSEESEDFQCEERTREHK